MRDFFTNDKYELLRGIIFTILFFLIAFLLLDVNSSSESSESNDIEQDPPPCLVGSEVPGCQ